MLEMELAALPGDGGKDGGSGGGETGMGVTDNEGEAMKAAGLEGGKEGAPVGFSLAQGDADAEDRAFPIEVDADGDKDGAVQELAALADLFVSGIQDDIGTGAQRAFPPGLKFAVELGGTGADLGGTHGVTAEFLDDFGDFASGDALDIHLGEGEQEGLFATDTFFESAGIKVHAVADLGNAEFDRAYPGCKGLGLEAV